MCVVNYVCIQLISRHLWHSISGRFDLIRGVHITSRCKNVRLSCIYWISIKSMLYNFWPFNLNKAGISFSSCSNGEKPVRLARAYFFKLRSLSWREKALSGDG